jgi:transcriptional regulator with XRE-family HTH domain
MPEIDQQAGAVLRTIRRRRKMTLEQAAPLLSMSVSALSRRERGLERILRTEIERAVEIYDLNFWEMHELWRASGYLPNNQGVPATDDDWQDLARTILNELGYPGWFVDPVGHIVAWNTCMDRLWELSKMAGEEPPHAFDVIIFSERSKQLLREDWRSTVLKLISYNYHATLPLSTSAEIQEMLSDYRRKYGQEFEDLWEAAGQVDPYLGSLGIDIESSTITLHTEAGPIRFLYLASALPYAANYGFYVLLPIGEASRQTYQRLCRKSVPGAYFASPDGTTD